MPTLSPSSIHASEAHSASGKLGDVGIPLPENQGEVPFWRSGVILLLAVLVGLSYWLDPMQNLPPQSGVVMELPNQVGNFHGTQGKIAKVELEQLPSDTEFARKNYNDFMGHELVCSIVLSGIEKRSIHRPEACLTGQGWSIIGQQDIPIDLKSGRQLTIRNLSLERQTIGTDKQRYSVRAFYMYWFVGEKVTTQSHFVRIWLTSWDRVFNHRAHRWAYVSVFSPITKSFRRDGLDADQTKTLLTGFIQEVVPTFQKSEMPDQVAN